MLSIQGIRYDPNGKAILIDTCVHIVQVLLCGATGKLFNIKILHMAHKVQDMFQQEAMQIVHV
jgi:hypothetical protein